MEVKNCIANIYTMRDCFAIGVILLAVSESAFSDWIDAADTVQGAVGICASSVLMRQSNIHTA